MILIRSALFNLFFYGVTLLLILPATAVRLVAPQRVLGFAAFWARIVLAGSRIICGISVEVSGLDRITAGAALIASSHQSAFDTLVWLTLTPRCCYVLKRELVRIPLVGPLTQAAGMIAIDRSAGSAALRALMRQAEQAARAGRQIVIFPEGTRSEPGTVRPLQPGVAAIAARTGLPVIPVATNSGLCWGRRAFLKRPGTIRIVVNEPIPPSLRKDALMTLLQRRIDLDAAAQEADAIGRESVDKSVQCNMDEDPIT